MKFKELFLLLEEYNYITKTLRTIESVKLDILECYSSEQTLPISFYGGTQFPVLKDDLLIVLGNSTDYLSNRKQEIAKILNIED